MCATAQTTARFYFLLNYPREAVCPGFAYDIGIALLASVYRLPAFQTKESSCRLPGLSRLPSVCLRPCRARTVSDGLEHQRTLAHESHARGCDFRAWCVSI